MVESLIATLKDREWKVRGVAIFVLGQLGDTRAIPELERVTKEDSNQHVRNTAKANLNHLMARDFVNSETRLAEAESLAKEAVELQPDNAAFHDTLGWAFYKQGKYTEAIAALEKAIALQRHFAPAHYHLGLAYLKTSKREKGMRELETAFTLDERYREAAKRE